MTRSARRCAGRASLVSAQARFELPKLASERLTAGVQGRWQDLTQISYFGNGPETLEDERSEYRLKSTNIVGYVAYHPAPRLAISADQSWRTQHAAQLLTVPIPRRECVVAERGGAGRDVAHADVAVFMDAGNVAPKVGDLNFDRKSYGVGMRLHSGSTTFVP